VKYGRKSILKENLRGKINSIFPSATTAVIPMFFTGSSCLKHGMISWYSYSREFKEEIIPLPYMTRAKPRKSLGKIKKITKIFNLNPLFKGIKRNNYHITKNKILNSDFSKAVCINAKRLGYNTTAEFFGKIKNTIKSNDKEKYIFAYLSTHDSYCHRHGTKSRKTLEKFKYIDKRLKSFLKSIKNTDSIIIITADHGLIDVPNNKKIRIEDNPELEETLRMPICGDGRNAFCFVKRDKRKQFENYVKTRLKKYCDIYNSKDLIKYFGLEKPSKQFLERIGDYILIMKENYGIYQHPWGEKHGNLAEHGGLSDEEMYVPLIIKRNKNQGKL